MHLAGQRGEDNISHQPVTRREGGWVQKEIYLGDRHEHDTGAKKNNRESRGRLPGNNS